MLSPSLVYPLWELNLCFSAAIAYAPHKAQRMLLENRERGKHFPFCVENGNKHLSIAGCMSIPLFLAQGAPPERLCLRKQAVQQETSPALPGR